MPLALCHRLWLGARVTPQPPRCSRADRERAGSGGRSSIFNLGSAPFAPRRELMRMKSASVTCDSLKLRQVSWLEGCSAPRGMSNRWRRTDDFRNMNCGRHLGVQQSRACRWGRVGWRGRMVRGHHVNWAPTLVAPAGCSEFQSDPAHFFAFVPERRGN